VFFNEIHGFLVKWCTDGDKVVFFDFADETLKLILCQARLGEAFDVFYIHPVFEVRVNEGIQVTVLEFEPKPERVVLAHIMERTDNFLANLYIPHVVVGHLENKQIIKDIVVAHYLPRVHMYFYY
jgi:hypothetical protein